MSSACLRRQAPSSNTWDAAVTVLALALVVGTPTASAQEPIKGEEALKHPAVQLAVKAAELVKAGKVEEVFALGTKAGQSELKSLSAADRKDFLASIVKKTPDPKAFSDAVRNGGELNVFGNTAILNAPVANGRVMAYFEREGSAWRLTNGPMVVVDEPAPVNETRVENAEILTHPIGTLALQYLDLVHAGKIDDAKKLATSGVQAKWKAESAKERAESLAYLKKNLPTRADVTAGLKDGKTLRGVLIIEDDKAATLNLIRSEQRQTAPGNTTYSSTTTAIGFAKEGGQWKLAQ